MSVCISILEGNQAVASRLAQLSPIDTKLCSVVKAELYYGDRASQQIAANLATLEHFLEPFESLPFDDASARLYRQLRADLKRTGQPISPNYMMITAIALARGLVVATHNTREFARVPGLRLEDREEREQQS